MHVHAYDPQTGLQNDDRALTRGIIEGIRAVEDVIVYPMIPFIQSADAFRPGAAEARFRAVDVLAQRGLLGWSVVHTGSINPATFVEAEMGGPGSIYLNPGEHIRRSLDLAARFGFVTSYAIYEPGFVRLGEALARVVSGCPAPVYGFLSRTCSPSGSHPSLRPGSLSSASGGGRAGGGLDGVGVGCGTPADPRHRVSWRPCAGRGEGRAVRHADAELGMGGKCRVAGRKAGGRAASAAEIRRILRRSGGLS